MFIDTENWLNEYCESSFKNLQPNHANIEHKVKHVTTTYDIQKKRLILLISSAIVNFEIMGFQFNFQLELKITDRKSTNEKANRMQSNHCARTQTKHIK